MILKGKTFWDIKQVRKSWEQPYHELAFTNKDQRILPDEYQCNDLRLLNKTVIVKDNFLLQNILTQIQQTADIMLQRKDNWSSRLQKDIKNNIFEKSEKRKQSFHFSEQEIEFIECAILAVVNCLWTTFSEILITYPERINHIHAWINCGPLSDGQAGKYHFTHYDCDEYLEFSKGLYRFPVYAAVFYIDIPEKSEGGVIWFPEIKQGIIPKNNRLTIFDPRLAHSVLPIIAPDKSPRVVMVMNIWDYETRDEQYELTNGILGYTTNRTGELEWLP